MCATPILPQFTSHVLFDYSLNNIPIQVVDCHRDLGILMSCDLKWWHHLNFISSRAYKILGLIRRSFSSRLPLSSKKKLYLSLVRSQLTYASQIWRPNLLKDISALERIQRRATKYIQMTTTLTIEINSCHSTFYH